MVNWVEHAKHRAEIVDSFGQWVGLLDEDAVPIMDLPPAIDLAANKAAGSVEEIAFTFGVRARSGVTHKAVDELIAKDLARIDSTTGQLVPSAAATRFVAVERPGAGRNYRAVYRVTHCVAEGPTEGPTTLTVNGLDVAGFFELIPAWSVPLSITGVWHDLDRDFVKPWSRLRTVQNLEIAAQADGFTLAGPAVQVLHRLVKESLEATWRAENITADPPAVVADIDDTAASPEILLRPVDDPLWDQIVELAQMAGVSIGVDLWWPGDPQPAGHMLSAPTIVMTLEQEAKVV